MYSASHYINTAKKTCECKKSTFLHSYNGLLKGIVTSHYPQVAAARIKSDNGGILLSPNNLSLR